MYYHKIRQTISSSNPLPNCGPSSAGFSAGDPAGCLCESAFNHSRSCIWGQWASSNSAVIARPYFQWRLDQNSTFAADESGNAGGDATLQGTRGIDYQFVIEAGGVNYTKLTGVGYVLVGDLNGFQFANHDFAVEATIRYNSLNVNQQMIATRRANCYSSFWTLFLRNGSLYFEVGDATNRSSQYVQVISLNRLDSRWHVVRGQRRGDVCEVYIDDNLDNALPCPSFKLESLAPLLIGAEYCETIGRATTFFVGDIANVSVYVDALPGSALCSVNATGFIWSSMLPCDRLLGFCSGAATALQQPCCAVIGCVECAEYITCSRNYTVTPSTMSLIASNPVDSLPAISRMSDAVMSAAIVSGVIGGVLVIVLIIVVVVRCNRDCTSLRPLRVSMVFTHLCSWLIPSRVRQ
jgi:hypothetical protein